MCAIHPLPEEPVFTATDLFRGNSAVMLVIDPVSLTVIDANDAAIAFFGYAKETFPGMPVSAARASRLLGVWSSLAINSILRRDRSLCRGEARWLK